MSRREAPTDPFTVLVVAVIGGGILSGIGFGVDPFYGFLVLSITSLVVTIAGVAYAVVWGLRVNRHEELMIEHYMALDAEDD